MNNIKNGCIPIIEEGVQSDGTTYIRVKNLPPEEFLTIFDIWMDRAFGSNQLLNNFRKERLKQNDDFV
ncbi:MAG: hypothetical protein LIR46_02895 [Bacteroidota bacterium]|nr:hypothetical protein [Bacteroidota bacterium]